MRRGALSDILPGMPRLPAAKSPVHRFAHEAMATAFEIFVAGKARAYAGQAARAAFDEADRLERLFSRFDPASEVSRLGRLRPGEAMRVGVETSALLRTCEEFRTLTRGAFDVNFRAAGPGGGIPLGEVLRLEPVPGGFEALRLAGHGPAALDLDLGAAGKGFAVDAAMSVLDAWGIDDALVHAGTSSVLARGSAAPGRGPAGWPVGIPACAVPPRGPAAASAGTKPPRGGRGAGPTAAARVLLADRALGASGPQVKGGHIVDPRTGRPVRTSAWVSHASAAAADILSTAFAVMAPAEIGAVCRARRSVWACVIPEGESCRIWNPGALAGRRSPRSRSTT